MADQDDTDMGMGGSDVDEFEGLWSLDEGLTTSTSREQVGIPPPLSSQITGYDAIL